MIGSHKINENVEEKNLYIEYESNHCTEKNTKEKTKWQKAQNTI